MRCLLSPAYFLLCASTHFTVIMLDVCFMLQDTLLCTRHFLCTFILRSCLLSPWLLTLPYIIFYVLYTCLPSTRCTTCPHTYHSLPQLRTNTSGCFVRTLYRQPLFYQCSPLILLTWLPTPPMLARMKRPFVSLIFFASSLCPAANVLDCSSQRQICCFVCLPFHWPAALPYSCPRQL